MKFGDGQDGVFFDEEVLHHPEGDDARSLLGGELKDSAVG